jgi:aminoglycoside 6'-N-acetyltransferase
VLRPARPEDAAAVAEILAEPEVSRWWGYADVDGIGEEIEGGGSFVIDVGGTVAGWLLVEENTDPMYRSVGLDIALSTAHHGHGYGREALSMAIRHFIMCGHHRFSIDPAASNERAIHTYAELGFKPVGVLREYERGPDGTWHDGLLMDLLARDFRG